MKSVTAMPALMMPIGEREFDATPRLSFMALMRAKLLELGWTFGVELKGDSYSQDEWTLKCAERVTSHNGCIVWHPPSQSTYGLGQTAKLSGELIGIAQMAHRLKDDFGLKALTLHLDPVVSQFETNVVRFQSPISAQQMIDHLQNQIGPLQEMQEICGGILHIENLDITKIDSAGQLSHLALFPGSWRDIVWIKEQAKVGITFDLEHFLGAKNFLMRQNEHRYLSSFFPWTAVNENSDEQKLAEITGYWLRQNHIPISMNRKDFTVKELIQLCRPKLYHLGGGTQLFNQQQQRSEHLPYDYSNKEQMSNLDEMIRGVISCKAIGAVVEVVGRNFDLDSSWSNRPYDDENAKMMSYLTVLDRIEQIVNNDEPGQG